MSVQTRTQLQASSATITNETAVGANTAARVGGLFDDLSDTATLDRERGVANLFIATPANFVPTLGSAVKLTTAMSNGVLSAYNFSRTNNSITYTGTTNALLRVAVNLVVSQTNNAQIKIYIAKNGAIIAESMADLTMTHNNGHAVYAEAVLQGAVNDKFEVFINAVDHPQDIVVSALTFTAHTL